jgi:adenosyl cobinamide kinase/adenosyl cobinamide phosphate guanylyltransferase
VITLVIGGTRSGKSRIAEQMAGRLVGEGASLTLIVPTVANDPDLPDLDFLARIQVHQARRPASWTTVECGADLIGALRAVDEPALIDSLGSWVAATADFAVAIDELVAVLRARSQPTVVVSEEVGLSVHAPTEVGRRFVDVLGTVSTAVADVADDVWLVVAGRVVRLDSLREVPRE